VAVCESKEYLLSSHCLVSTRLFSIMWRGKGERACSFNRPDVRL
jgi:hypothetical protein